VTAILKTWNSYALMLLEAKIRCHCWSEAKGQFISCKDSSRKDRL